MNLNQKQLAVVKRLAKRWRERAVPLAPGQLRLHLNPDWVSQNWRDFNRIKKYKTKKSTIYLIPRGFPTFLTPEEKAGLATGLVWVVFPKSKNKKSIVIKHYAPSSRGQANLFKYQRRLFKRGEPVPEPLKLLEAGKGNKKLVWIESEEGIAINQLSTYEVAKSTPRRSESRMKIYQ